MDREEVIKCPFNSTFLNGQPASGFCHSDCALYSEEFERCLVAEACDSIIYIISQFQVFMKELNDSMLERMKEMPMPVPAAKEEKTEEVPLENPAIYNSPTSAVKRREEKEEKEEEK